MNRITHGANLDQALAYMRMKAEALEPLDSEDYLNLCYVFNRANYNWNYLSGYHRGSEDTGLEMLDWSEKEEDPSERDFEWWEGFVDAMGDYNYPDAEKAIIRFQELKDTYNR